MSDTKDPSVSHGTHRAGLFDIRTIIGILIGAYGVILLIVSFVNTSKQVDKADGVNINLWTGIGMIVASVLFLAWARLRPIVVPEEPEAGTTNDADRPAAH